MIFIFGFLPFLLVMLGLNIFRVYRRTFETGRFPRGGQKTMNTRPSQVDGALFRLAKRRGGRITLSDIVIETGLGLKEAERYMDAMADQSHVSLEADDRGRPVYLFPELLDDTEDRP